MCAQALARFIIEDTEANVSHLQVVLAVMFHGFSSANHELLKKLSVYRWSKNYKEKHERETKSLHLKLKKKK